MSVPLDRLYHFLDDCVNHDLVIYRWLPHGSIKPEDLKPLCDYSLLEYTNLIPVICHDQEPLNYDYYSASNLQQLLEIADLAVHNVIPDNKEMYQYRSQLHLRALLHDRNCYDKTLLVHSEQHGSEINKYQDHGFITAYYWSHALLSQDWFRYANLDPVLKKMPGVFNKDFLIYNRAWSGTREYRLQFLQQLVKHDMVSSCQTTVLPVDQSVHFSQHKFCNKDFSVDIDLEQYFDQNHYDSSASADYCADDYIANAMEVVLETLFDDCRWHLTEKTLRPIACGKPFLLMSTAGSLQYLRNYGFETFGEYIDESYDQIANSKQRLLAVIAEMKRISRLSNTAKQKLYQQLHGIAENNKIHFFENLHDIVVKEFSDNFDQAVSQIKQHQTGKICQQVKQLWLEDSNPAWVELWGKI